MVALIGFGIKRPTRRPGKEHDGKTFQEVARPSPPDATPNDTTANIVRGGEDAKDGISLDVKRYPIQERFRHFFHGKQLSK